MRISDWSSDVCSSDRLPEYAANIVLLKSADVVGVSWGETVGRVPGLFAQHMSALFGLIEGGRLAPPAPRVVPLEQAADRIAAMANRQAVGRSEEHTSELQSLMRISYAVFCLKKKK